MRDMVMRKKPVDYDISTDAAPAQIKRIFKKTVFVGKEFGTVLVVREGMPFQVTTFRSEKRNEFSKNPKTDALNRDFSINALFYEPVKKRLIDYVGGKKDISRKIIRTVSNPQICFRQDRLRPLRAIRFCANLGFKIEKDTFAAIKKFNGRIKKVSSERLRDELVKIMTGRSPYRGMKFLDETGLLEAILPEIEALKGVQQPPRFHPEGDVFTHTMLLIKALRDSDVILAFACLLHDVGKPATFKKAERIRFDGHDRVGADLTTQILKRLRFSNEEVRKITYCVENHMRVMNAMKMRESTLKRMFLKDTFETEMELHRLDCMASHSDLKIYKFLKKKYEEFKKTPVLPRPLLNGHEIMAMGFEQGPIIGKIQSQMLDLQLEGKLRSKKEAEEWIKKNA